MSTEANVTGVGLGRKLLGFAQLGKLRVYQHMYAWLLAVLLLLEHGISRPGMFLALVLCLVALIAVQCAACAADDVVGFRNGSDAANYESSQLRSVSRKPLLTGVISETEGVVFGVVSWVVGLAAGIGAASALGWDIPWQVVVGFLFVHICAVQYSWGFQFSYRPGGLEFIMFVVPASGLLLTYWLVNSSLDADSVIMSALTGVWFLLVVSYGNASDRDGDAQAGRRTLAVILTPRKYNILLAGLYICSVALVILVFVLGDMRPLWIVFTVPVLLLHSLQLFYGVFKGRMREARLIGFPSIDLGCIGLAAAILLS